jgi:hypothetical protein
MTAGVWRAFVFNECYRFNFQTAAPLSVPSPLAGRGIAYGFLAHIALAGDLDSEGLS